MNKVKSDLTNKNFGAGHKGGFRTIEVTDESDQLYDYSQDQGPPPNLEGADLETVNAHLRSRGLPPIESARLKAQARQPQARQPEPVRQAEDVPMEEFNEIDNQIRYARKVKSSGKERLSEGAKNRIETLCDMFRKTKEVEIEGQVFVLRTLKGKEIKQALMASAAFDGTVELAFESRRQFLARSLTHVAGNEIGMFLGDNSIEAKLEFIEELDEPIIARLNAEYAALDKLSKDKYKFQSAADADEVSADLKK